VVTFSSFRFEHGHQNAGHEIDQFGSCRGVDRHGNAFFSDNQVQKL
jgi:hypothetical protein